MKRWSLPPPPPYASLHTECCKILPITHLKENVRVDGAKGKGKGGRSSTSTVTTTPKSKGQDGTNALGDYLCSLYLSRRYNKFE
jgi:hypothetical protein